MPNHPAGNTRRLTQALKAEARRLGFTLAGVTTPEPPPHGRVFLDWLENGFHGEMAYLDTERSRQRRQDPKLILPECQSILVLGFPYLPAGPASEKTPAGKGKVAAYAWGDDYHDLTPPRLQELVGFLEERLDRPVPNRWYTDTGPLLERDLAQRAGLGWTGKNTCLIHPQQGSYFFLAEILLGIELEADPPFVTDHCGTCTRCLEACPTGCILPDRTLDARRCISYLTIELKGTVPRDLRPQMGTWVFGCDVCQQVCPWNVRFASPEAVGGEFAPRPGAFQPGLPELLALSPQEFNQRYRGSPVIRAKRRGLLRNAAVAAGNAALEAGSAGWAALITVLGKALLDEAELLVRGHAAWALGQIGGDEVRRLLRQAIQQEQDEMVLGEIGQALDEAS